VTVPEKQFNVALNGYRGLCTLAVFVYHLGSAGVVDWPTGSTAASAATFVWSSLRYGVEMFFMISGFVIMGSLLRHATVRRFLSDRFIRIYSAWVPALVAVTAMCVLLRLSIFRDAGLAEIAAVFGANLILLPPIVPVPMIHFASWSLTYEWIFYLLAAAGVMLHRRATTPRWVEWIWVLSAAAFVCAFPRALFFLTGVLVFYHREWFARRRRWLQLPVVSLLVFLIAWRLTRAGKADLNDTLVDMLQDGRWIAVCVAFAASVHLFASVCLNAGREFAFLCSRTFQFLGNVSYSFYLWHSLVMSVVKRTVVPLVEPRYGSGAALLAFGVSCLLVALPLSWASWRLCEVRLAKWMRRRMEARHAVLGVPRAA